MGKTYSSLADAPIELRNRLYEQMDKKTTFSSAPSPILEGHTLSNIRKEKIRKSNGITIDLLVGEDLSREKPNEAAIYRSWLFRPVTVIKGDTTVVKMPTVNGEELSESEADALIEKLTSGSYTITLVRKEEMRGLKPKYVRGKYQYCSEEADVKIYHFTTEETEQ